ncbi:helicase [Thermus phage MN1]|nr:helicase [Thermus phage MN1]
MAAPYYTESRGDDRMVAARVNKSGSSLVWRGPYEAKGVPKGAGWRWDPLNRVWTAPADPLSLRRLLEVAEEEGVRVELDEGAARLLQGEPAGEPNLPQVEIPTPNGLRPFPFQVEGARFLLSREGALLGDEMGLGKTVQVLLAVNADPSIRKVLIVCPASVKLNWEREARRWLTRHFETLVLSGATPSPIPTPKGDEGLFVVINYDIVAAWEEELRRHVWDLMVLDEAHYVKDPNAKRSKAILGPKARNPIPARKRVALTGTPIVNRPVELWPILAWLDYRVWGNFWAYAKRYCDAHYNGYGWDFRGASNLEELRRRLRPYMLRREKGEVLQDLPEKIREIIILPRNGLSALVEEEWAIWNQYQERLSSLREQAQRARQAKDKEELARILSEIRAVSQVAFNSMSTIRARLAEAKAPKVAAFVKDLLEEKEKVVVFAHHRAVLEYLREALKEYHPVLVWGGMSAQARQAAVDAFQSGEAGVFLGSITAAAEGITLTASDTLVFAELDWRPGKMLQAEDRVHRIGQDRGVLIYYLVIEDSLEARMANVIASKMEVIRKAVENGGEEEVPLLLEEVAKEPRKAAPTSNGKGIRLTPEEEALVREALQIVAGYDPDKARARNGVGFSKFDGELGHELAQTPHYTPRQALVALRLARKYRGQLPPDLAERVTALAEKLLTQGE